MSVVHDEGQGRLQSATVFGLAVLVAALPATVAVTLFSLGLLVYFAIRASDESRRAQLSTF